MSENSLRIREKYISKLFRKIQDLEEGINLLGQVDRRILRNSIQTGGAYLENLEAKAMYLQRGGGSSGGGGENDIDQIRMKQIQENALIQKARIDEQEEQLNRASQTIRSLNLKTFDLRTTLENLSDLISSIKLKNVNLPKSYPFDLDSWNPILIYNAYHGIPFNELINPLLSDVKDIATKPEKLDAGKKPRATPDDIAEWNINETTYKQLVERLKAKDPVKNEKYQIGSILQNGVAKNKIVGEEGDSWILEKKFGPSKIIPKKMVFDLWEIVENTPADSGVGGGGVAIGSSSAPLLGSSSTLGRAPSGSTAGAAPVRASSLPLPSSASSLPLGSKKPEEERKYYSNSVTSSEMPDRVMLSETSFF